MKIAKFNSFHFDHGNYTALSLQQEALLRYKIIHYHLTYGVQSLHKLFAIMAPLIFIMAPNMCF